MSQPERTYGSDGVPEPPVTPLAAVKSASPRIRMWACDTYVGARTRPEGIRAARRTTATASAIARPLPERTILKRRDDAMPPPRHHAPPLYLALLGRSSMEGCGRHRR